MLLHDILTSFFKKNLSHSADIVYCVCLFVITHIILSGKLLRFLTNTDDGVCSPYSSCDEDDSTQSSIHNSHLLSSFYSHILWSKNMLLLSHYRFVTHQNVSSFLRNRLVQKIKILRIFLKIEMYVGGRAMESCYSIIICWRVQS